LFVLGMARSGTSALTRVVSLCGGTLPAGMVGGFVGNPAGYWEPRKAVRLNETILRRHGSAGYDPSLRLQEDGALDAEARAACIAKIRRYLSTLPAAPLVVIKEPQITALSDMWFEAARHAGFDVAAAIAVRHPQEVVESFGQRRPGNPKALSGALWLRYSLLAERGTRGLPRVFVEYANLLEDWRREVKRISAALPFDLAPPRESGAIEEFLKPGLQHQRNCGPVTELFGTDWISSAYQTLGAAARDEPLDVSVLDHIFEAYRVYETDFRSVFADFRRLQKLDRFSRPSLTGAVLEILAMAHGRKGTWA
jgi:hypothetical protein